MKSATTCGGRSWSRPARRKGRSGGVLGAKCWVLSAALILAVTPNPLRAQRTTSLMHVGPRCGSVGQPQPTYAGTEFRDNERALYLAIINLRTANQPPSHLL